jgi:hypothetical protein
MGLKIRENKNPYRKKRIKINKIKATFTGRSPRHTQVGHPEDTHQKPRVEIRAANGRSFIIFSYTV